MPTNGIRNSVACDLLSPCTGKTRSSSDGAPTPLTTQPYQNRSSGRPPTAVVAIVLTMLACVLCARPTHAQNTGATIRGFVTSASSGQPLIDVNVFVQDSLGQVFGSVTEENGVYLIARLAAGEYVLQATHVGYHPFTDTLAVLAGELRELDIEMRPRERSLDVVEIVDDRVSRSTEIQAGLQTVKPADIELIPSPDITGDLALFLQALPGVVTIGDQGGQLFIRGGEPSQNLVLLDGILLYQPFHLLSFYSAFSSDIIAQADVYAGGFGSKYGGRLSSVIDVTSRSGNLREFGAEFTASPFQVSGLVEGPIDKAGKLSMLFVGRHSIVEEVASSYLKRDIPFRFNDFFGKIYGVARQNGRVSFTGIRTYDRGTVGDDIGITPLSEIRYTNEGIGGRYLYLPGSIPVLGEFAINASRLSTELGPSDAPIRTSTVERINISADISHYVTIGQVKWGVFARTLGFDSALGGTFQDLTLDREFVTESGIYLEPLLRLSNGMEIEPGLRVHAFPSRSDVFVEPRFRMNWDRGRDQISAAIGVYHQEVVGVNDRRDATSVFTAWAATPGRASVPRAVHIIAGYRIQPAPRWDVSAETYFKDLSNLFIAEWTAYPRLTTRLQPADGRVFGVDLRAEYRHPRVYAYINYGLSSVEYRAKQPSLLLWFGSETFKFRPAHDRRHQINAVVSTDIRGFNISMRWQFGSGLPFNRALGFDGFVLLDSDIDVFESEGDRRVIYERPFNGILPTYHRLDVSVEKTLTIGTADFTILGSVINTYDRANIFYLDVFTLRRANQFPLVPSLGIKASFNQ